MSRFGACNVRISGDRHTHTQTHTQNDYRNPRCACTPRVNNVMDAEKENNYLLILLFCSTSMTFYSFTHFLLLSPSLLLTAVQDLPLSTAPTSASSCNCDNSSSDESTTQTVLIFFVILLILLLCVAVGVAIWGVVMTIKRLKRVNSKNYSSGKMNLLFLYFNTVEPC